MIKCFLTPITPASRAPAATATAANNSPRLPVPCTEPIELKNGYVVILGRGPTTKITDSKCSRDQIEIQAHFGKRTVSVRQLGPNNSALNDEPIGIGLKVDAKSGDVINLLFKEGEGRYQYKVHFEGAGVDADADRLIKSKDMEMPDSNSNPNPKPAKIPKMFTDLKGKKNTGGGGSQASNFLKSASEQQQQPKGSWSDIDGGQLIVYSFMNPKPAATVTAFDMDGTLITTQSGRVFPKDDRDWKFCMNTVAKLQSYWKQSQNSEPVRIVIISNQAGLAGKAAPAVTSFKGKVESILSKLGVPCIFFASTDKASKYRKPLPFLWHDFVEQYNDGIEPDRAKSFYCGDAAGRIAGAGKGRKKADFSCSDRLFALNLGLDFKTPEEFFLGSAAPPPTAFKLPDFSPADFLLHPKSNQHLRFLNSSSQQKELVLMVGFPGSGKSRFVETTLVPRGYMHVNRDKLKTAEKCHASARSALEGGQNVVVDNTNPKKKDRKEYIALAKRYQARVRCLKMEVGFEHAQHNNKFRQLTGSTHEHVPGVAFNTYRAQYEEPDLEEGFDEIVSVHFVPEFLNDEDRILYGLYMLEK